MELDVGINFAARRKGYEKESSMEICGYFN